MNSIGDIGKALERYLRKVKSELSARQYEMLTFFVDELLIAELEWQELTARIAELEAENARLKAEQAAPKKDVADLISGLDRASLALDALENLLNEERQ